MRRGRWGAAFTVFGLVLFITYLTYTNPFKILTEVGRFDPWTFMAAVLVNYVGLFFLSASWFMVLRVLGVEVSLWRSVQITFVSMFTVWMFPFPSGVEIIRSYLVRDSEGGNIGKAVSSVLVSKIYYYISFGVMITLAAVIVTWVNGSGLPVQPVYVWFVVAFALGNTVIIGLVLDPGLLRKVYGRSPEWVKRNLFDRLYSTDLGLGGFSSFIDEVDESMFLLRRNPMENILSLLLVGFHWSTGAITAYMVTVSLGYRISFWVIVLIYAVIEFIQQLNILIPSGLGVVDAGLTGAFVLVGVPLAAAAAISLLTRLATYWLELVLCGLVSFQFGYREALGDYLN
jgi:uncharacterized protein (TIRG00374 family)